MSRRARLRFLIPPLILLMNAGCIANQQEHLATYVWTDDATAVRLMARHAQSVRSINSACSITLTRADGQSIRLEGAVAMAPPEKNIRLRTWKFNQAVFDLTLTSQGLWLELPRDEDRRPQVLPASLSAVQLARALSLFGSDFFYDPRLRVLDTGGAEFQLRKPLGQDQIVLARVDRATLTIRQYRLLDSSGHVRFTLELKQYRQFGDVVWPTRLIATSGGSKIDLELRDVRINIALPPNAFIPPPRAEKVP